MNSLAIVERSGRHVVRVSYVITLLDKMGGAEKNLCDLVTNLDRDRFFPYVLAFTGGQLTEQLARAGVPVIVNNVTKILSLDALRKGVLFYRFLKKEKIDIVVTYHHDADIWGGLIARLSGVPVVIASRRDMGYQLQAKHILYYRLFHCIYSKFIAVSEAVKKIVAQREWIPFDKIQVIYNGLDISLYEKDNDAAGIRKELGIPASAPVVGMVASFRPVKGQMYLVEAAPEVVAACPDVKFMLAGYNNTDYFLQVKERIAALGLEENFIFLGNRSDIPKLLQVFDIFVISSEQEGFSNAIIEAMAAGLPVVASNCGGNPEAVEDHVTGLLFPARDHSALAAALKKLVLNPTVRRRSADNGREKVRRIFQLAGMIKRNEDLYLRLLGRHFAE